jgi:ribose-phosphate pyrophosphokinase
LEHLSAVKLLGHALAEQVPSDAIVVAPDMGAIRLAEQYARLLNLPMAIVHKMRISSEEVVARSLIGDVKGRTPLIVDDMIATGATIEAALKFLLANGSASTAIVAATHGLLVGPAVKRLAALPIKRLLLTDSLSLPAGLPLPLEVITLAPLLAEVISRLHSGASLNDLIDNL